MSSNDFPEIDDYYLGKYRHGLSPGSQAIYLLAVTLVFAFLICLPLIKIDVSVSSSGVLQTSANKVVVSSNIDGRVVKSKLLDNQKVLQGDTLLILDASATEMQVHLNQNRQFLLQQYLDDLRILLDIDLGSAGNLPLKSGRYRASYLLFLQEKGEKQHLADQEARNFERFNKLFQERVISDSEFERHRNTSEMARLASSTFHQRYREQLEQEFSVLRDELLVLVSAGIDLNNQRQLGVIKAPVKGTLQLKKELTKGIAIVANEVLAEISPDSVLMAYCFVKPSDIALIRVGQEVYFNVDAFNYHEWGWLEGRVHEISDDVIFKSNGTTVYQIRCIITRNFMESKGGVRRSLRKGMTLYARFRVNKRSLYQLLHDKVDNWINPIRESGRISQIKSDKSEY